MRIVLLRDVRSRITRSHALWSAHDYDLCITFRVELSSRAYLYRGEE